VSEAGVSVATLTLTRYSTLGAVAGAFHMASHRPALARVPGLRFWKLVGTGSGIGFSQKPDLRIWGLFAVWDSRADWDRFLDGSRVMDQYRARGEESYSLVLEPTRSHGKWDGVEPFGALPRTRSAAEATEPVAVLTRASIRLTRQAQFWRAVPAVDATLHRHPDILLTFGIGEIPYLRQATLSVWRSEAAMREWAYRNAHHADVVRRTRAENWYAEDMFARFRLLATHGTFNGVDPLAKVVASPV